jgi:hypothetical protein
MTVPEPSFAAVMYRVEQLERRADATEPRLGATVTMAERHEQEIYGDRGINKTIRELALQVRWVQRALWGLAASIIIAELINVIGNH